MNLYVELLYRPLLNTLFFLYGLLPFHDIGLAIILLTLLVRLVLLSPTVKTIRHQKRLSVLQPKVDALKQLHGHDKERMAKELMELYKQEKVNPLSSCLPLLIQLPLLIALYRVFQVGLSVPPDGLLYSFVARPTSISPMFLGAIDLAKPNIILVVITAAVQYLQMRTLPTAAALSPSAMPEGERQAKLMNTQMQFIGPVLTLVIGLRLPSALILYWLVSTLFQLGTQWYGLRGGERKAMPA